MREPVKEQVKVLKEHSKELKEKQTALKSPIKEAKEENKQSEEMPKEPLVAEGAFWEKVQSFLKANSIVLQESAVIKKKTEFDVVLELSSPVGVLSYYCKVKSKKKIADTDLSAAFVQGQLRKLPVIFLTDGELAKSAKNFLVRVKGITVKQV